MNIILTVDVELWTWRGDFFQDVELPLELLCKFMEEEEVPVTFFISLSDKGLGKGPSNNLKSSYLDEMQRVSPMLNSCDYAEVGIHTHCRNLPLPFDTDSDYLSSYSPAQVEAIVKWYVSSMDELFCKKVSTHRAAGYKLPSSFQGEYYRILVEQGIVWDSSDITSEMIFSGNGGVSQIPPSTVSDMANRQQVWSSDTMSLTELIDFYQRWSKSVMVMNFHSFLLANSAFFQPDSTSMSIWLKMPAFLQRPLRLPLKAFKSAYRRFPSTTNYLDQASSRFTALKEIIQYLKQADCKFLNFAELKNEYLD